MLRIYHYLVSLLMYPFARTYLSVMSQIQRIRSFFNTDKVLASSELSRCQRILLVALYEKGELRSDIQELLRVAKNNNFFVIGVNTLRLDVSLVDSDYEKLFDVYIERFNFGRDFGSYKTGLKYIFSKLDSDLVARIVVLNDSVFYGKKHLEAFLAEMTMDYQVIGANENNEFSHHIGSFAWSVSGSVARSAKFRHFWRSYQNTDIRPKVIRAGELGLSKMLFSVAAAPSEICVLFSQSRLASLLLSDRGLSLIENYQNFIPDVVNWGSFPSLAEIAKDFEGKYIANFDDAMTYEVRMTDPTEQTRGELTRERMQYYSAWVTKPSEYLDHLFLRRPYLDRHSTTQKFHEYIAYRWIELYKQGSEVHLNCILNCEMGLPFAKLDLLYRGVVKPYEVERLGKAFLSDAEQEVFRTLMYRNPNGAKFLAGWKLAAYARGLI